MAIYYVKNGGNDVAAGTTDGTAWATLEKVNATSFSPGDIIQFRRGDTFRGSLYKSENGSSGNYITYGAYGTGDKPLILGSKNLTVTGDWEVHSGNVWKTTATLGTNQDDISNIVFNNEASVGIKMNSLVGCTSQGQFFYNTSDNLLYLYSTSNPASYYTNIEACGHHDLNQGLVKWYSSSYVTVQYLDFRYSSAAGIEFGESNHFIVEYCDLSWIGGEWYNSSTRVRLGNGISMINNVSYGIIRWNRVDQCYDAGISPQGWTAGYVQSDIAQYGNTITNCYYSYEGYGAATGCSMIRVDFYNNTCVDAANCWSNTSDQRSDYVNSRHVMIWKEDGTHTDCNIKNNIFSGTCVTAIRINEDDSYAIKHVFDNNCYNVTTVASTYHGTLTTLAQWQSTESQDPNGISADPLFASTEIYSLQSSSPCIDTGTNMGLEYQGLAPDIGVWEYTPEGFTINGTEFGQQYELRWWDLARCSWCAKFFVPSYEGAVEQLQGSGHPVVMEYQNGDDDFSDPYRPTQAKIEIKVGENWKFLDLFGPDIMSCWVEIYQGVDSDETLFFRGWVDPSQYEEPYDVPPYYLTITVVDGLSYLQDIKYAITENSDGTYDYYEDRELESTILWDIFSKIGVTEYNEYINLFAIEMAMTSANTPINQLLLERDRFYDMSCADVLIAILSKWRAVLRMNTDGVFEIFRPVDLWRGLVYGRHWTSATANSAISSSPIQYIHRTATHQESALIQVPGGVQMQINPAKKININQEYGSRESWLDNHILHRDSYDVYTQRFEKWTSITAGGYPVPLPISDILPREDEGVCLRRNANISQVFGDYARLAGEDELFKIEFEYGFYNTVATPKDGVIAHFLIVQSTKQLYKSATEDTELVWSNYYSTPIFLSTEPIDDFGYGWSGWKTGGYSFKGLPFSTTLTIQFYNGYSSVVHVCIKNIRFVAASSELSKITYKRSAWERIKASRFKLTQYGWGFIFADKYTLKDKYGEVDTITENTYNPICSVSKGSVLDYDFILGDIVKQSSPSHKGDTGITNNLEQFAGSLAIQAPESPEVAIQRFISTYGASFIPYGAELSYEENSAGVSMILFKAVVPGVDFGAAAAISSINGDIVADAYTITANQAGTRQLVEFTITGSSGYVNITINGITRSMMYYAESIEETIQHWIDLYAYLFYPVILDINSTYTALLITGDEEGNSFTYSVSNNGLTATESYYVAASAIGRRTDAIEISGTNGWAYISCAGNNNKVFSFGIAITVPSSEWCAGDNSSDAFPYKPLLQIIGDELAAQHSRTKFLIQMPIIERITGVKSGLNINGCIIDTQNKLNGTPRKFVINRGSFDIRHRKWELDLVELLPYEGVQEEIIPEPLPESSDIPPEDESSEGTPPPSSEDFGVVLNHVDTIASGRYGTAMTVSFEYNAAEARTANVRYYFSSDSAGAIPVTATTAVEVDFVAGTHTEYLSGITYPVSTAKYLNIYLEDDTDEHVISNSFDSVLIVFNHIDTISSPQGTGMEIDPAPSYSCTVSGGSLTVTVYWNIRNSSSQIVQSGSESFAFSTGTSDKQFTAVDCPSSDYEDCTFNIGFSAGSNAATSNTFTVASI